MTNYTPNKGNSVLFWSDTWLDQALDEKYPELYPFCKKPKCSVKFFLDLNVEAIFSPSLSTQAAYQLQDIDNILQRMNWDGSTDDIWSYSWGSRNFSSKKCYKTLVGEYVASPVFKWLWGSSNLGKHKFFFWLLLRDRLSTRNILRRKNMHLDDYTCVFCHLNYEETCFHLFFECPFSRSCWQAISVNLNTNLNPLDMFFKPE